MSGYIRSNVLNPVRSPGPSFRRRLDNALEVTYSAGKRSHVHVSLHHPNIERSDGPLRLCNPPPPPPPPPSQRLGRLALCARCVSVMQRLYPLEFSPTAHPDLVPWSTTLSCPVTVSMHRDRKHLFPPPSFPSSSKHCTIRWPSPSQRLGLSVCVCRIERLYPVKYTDMFV